MTEVRTFSLYLHFQEFKTEIIDVLIRCVSAE